jgi:prepilin-type N-terminal cleavage/methylation domain-containing protein
MFHVSRRGFTIVELLVALGIFVIITAMVVANFRAGSRSDELRIAAETLVSNLRKAQNMSLAGQLINGNSPPGGYGVYFKLSDTDRYIIFADLNGDLGYTAGEALADGTIILPRDIRILNIQPTAVSSAIFKPPKPTIYINGATTEATLSVTLKHNLSGKTRTVTVKRISGQIGAE